MHFLLRLVVFCFDPLGLGRRFFFRPVYNLGINAYEQFKGKADEKVESVRELLLRLVLIAFVVVLIISLAVFFFVLFYYTYMPPISHTRPVFMQFKTCLDTSAPCTFPHAHVPLTQKQQLLMVGQAYRVIVEIDMPESSQNIDLGMFMVCGEMRDNESMLRGHSCRSGMMRYKSPLIRTLSTWAYSPLFVLGLKEEFQKVRVEIFSQYLEQRHHPITDVYVEIQSHKIQFYSVSLHILADFTGLRYIMYNWPVLSATIGISSNLFFILIIFLLSWYHWSDAKWLRSLQDKYVRIQRSASKVLLEDGKNSLQDDEDFGDEKSNDSGIRNVGSNLSIKEDHKSKGDQSALRQRKT